MDTRMIEVALGLALVFALTSLFVTAVRELWSSVWGSRSKVLNMALASFLGDDPKFANTLMTHPLLVSLARDDAAGKPRPSYMGADIVVTSLIASLIDSSSVGIRPSTPLQFVEAVRSQKPRPGGPNSEFITGMASLIHGVENDWPGFEARLCAWYDSVTERSTGWFKRSNQASLLLIGFLMAAAANINPIVIATRLWQDVPMREALATAAQKAGNAYASATADAQAGAQAGAAGIDPAMAALKAAREAVRGTRTTKQEDTEKALAQLKGELEDARDRIAANPASGSWQSVSRALSQLLQVRSRMDVLRKADDGSTGAMREKLDAARDLEAAMAGLRGADSARDAAVNSLVTRRESLEKAISAERREQDEKNPTGGTRGQRRCAGTDARTGELCERLEDLTGLKSMGLPIGWAPFVAPEILSSDCVRNAACWDGQRVGNMVLVVVGWLITAIAASLGAPFWFDMLGKLAKLRAAGGKPSTTDESGAVTTPPGGTTLSMPSRGGGPGRPRGGKGAELGAGPGGGGGGPGAAAAASRDALNDAENSLSVSEIRRIQRALGNSPGGSALEVSGVLDGSTREAVRQWQMANDFSADGVLTVFQIARLLDGSGASGLDDTSGLAPVGPTGPVPPAPRPPASPAPRPSPGPAPTSPPSGGPALSGKDWVAKFPGSRRIEDCAEDFARGLHGFVDAMIHAGAKVEISATYRPPERAWLMHWSWKIVHDLVDPADVPPMAGVDIVWMHTDANGVPDLAGSKSAAREMVLGYGLVVQPAKQSRHTEGRAVDMTISWSGILHVATNSGPTMEIKGAPHDGTNPDLHRCGATYGVIKGTFKDPPHWSCDGH